MCEHFINSFAQKVLEKNSIYRVRMGNDIQNYYFQCSNEELLNKIQEHIFNEIVCHWKYYDQRNFYHNEQTLVYYEKFALKPGMKCVHDLDDFAKEHFQEMLKIYLQNKDSSISITKLKLIN